MKTLILTVLVLALTSCAANSEKPVVLAKEEVKQENTAITNAPASAAKNCICVKMWMPVCGKNKKTYGNSCEADCAGQKYTQGACQEKK